MVEEGTDHQEADMEGHLEEDMDSQGEDLHQEEEVDLHQDMDHLKMDQITTEISRLLEDLEDLRRREHQVTLIIIIPLQCLYSL